MKRLIVISRPTKLSNITFEGLYDDISRDWEYRARRLRARRWRMLKTHNARIGWTHQLHTIKAHN